MKALTISKDITLAKVPETMDLAANSGWRS